MQTVKVTTLVDITNSGVNRPDRGDETSYNQYKNWSTFLQCIGLRCIVDYEKAPKNELKDVKSFGFGSKYKGEHRVWTFIFHTDRDDVYLDKSSAIGLLLNDMHEVPIIKNLTETINIPKAVFDLSDINWKNTQVVLLDSSMEN